MERSEEKENITKERGVVLRQDRSVRNQNLDGRSAECVSTFPIIWKRSCEVEQRLRQI